MGLCRPITGSSNVAEKAGWQVRRRILRLVMITRAATSTAFALIGAMVVAPFVPAAASSWLGVAALGLGLWPLLVDMKNTAAIAVAHLGSIVCCFALGVHDENRSVWLTFAVLPLAWTFRRSGRAIMAAAGLVLGALSFGVFAWSAEQLDGGPLSALPQMLLFPAGAGIVMIVKALRPAKTPSAPAATAPVPPARPERPPWARDVS